MTSTVCEACGKAESTIFKQRRWWCEDCYDVIYKKWQKYGGTE